MTKIPPVETTPKVISDYVKDALNENKTEKLEIIEKVREAAFKVIGENAHYRVDNKEIHYKGKITEPKQRETIKKINNLVQEQIGMSIRTKAWIGGVLSLLFGIIPFFFWLAFDKNHKALKIYNSETYKKDLKSHPEYSKYFKSIKEHEELEKLREKFEK